MCLGPRFGWLVTAGLAGLILTAAGVARAQAPEPLLAFPPEIRPNPTLADLLPDVPSEDEYAEALAFTGWLDDGSRLNVTLAVSNIGIGSGNGGVKGQLAFADGSRVAFSEEVGGKWLAQASPFRYAMGPVSVTGSLGELVLRIDQKQLRGEVRFQARLPPFRPRGGRVYYGGPPDGPKTRYYDYVAAMPRAVIRGQLVAGGRTVRVHGRGFLERSRVTLYPFESATRWRSIKVYQGDTSVVMNWFRTGARFGSRIVAWLLVGHKGRIAWHTFNVRVDGADVRTDPEASTRYPLPWQLTIDARARSRRLAGGQAAEPGPSVTGTLTASRIVVREDTLKQLGRLRRAVVARFTRPMGYAQRCRYDLRVHLPGSDATIELKGDDGECWQSFL